ncbi:C1q-like domain-containing protein [Emticicia sp. C21]|uniref:C1q-like domain-containing protein n=1 Tax=Emticicia sp. C21 TaxID=2302915 RepID=UPI000E3448CC|nr:hypothetical protein [Emticicia sp. C21]RFS14990.1 hypothetical protein D0T08_18080 [Emticicia sp. C21]
MHIKLFVICTLISVQLSGQSVTILPMSTPNTNALGIKKVGIGLDHRGTDGIIGLGTYIGVTEGYVQTHTNHPLAFATNNGGVQMILKTNGYVGIGTDNPQYLLDLTQRARIRTSGQTAGIWFSKSNNNVNEGAFFGNLNDAQTGIYIGNNWRFSVSDAGVVNVPNLAGAGTRNVGADANGNLVALAAPSASTVGFSVGASATITIPGNNALTYLAGNEIEYNIGNAWSINPSQFTAPTNGLYHFTVKLSWGGHPSGQRAFYILKNYTDFIKGRIDFPRNNLTFKQYFTTTIYLNANDKIQLVVRQNSGYDIGLSGELFDTTIFSGFKIN